MLGGLLHILIQFPWVASRSSRGEQGAMEDCISQYGGLMWSIVRKYSLNQSDAEDLFQEIFTSLWKAVLALTQNTEQKPHS